MYLLDVNVLLALAAHDHDFHGRVTGWLKDQSRKGRLEVATCALTELAFVRILSQPVHGYSVQEAQVLLARIKAIPDLKFIFFADDLPVSELPIWVVVSSQVTNGHLAQLALKNDAKLATLDEKIPGAFLIPQSR